MYAKNKNVQMSIQKTMRIKKIESNFNFDFVDQRFQTQQAIQHADSNPDPDHPTP